MTEIECVEPCEKLLKCGHRCTKLCGKPCTYMCKSIVEVQLSCGHLAKKQCCEKVDDVKCSIKVDWQFCSIWQHIVHLFYISRLRYKSSGLSVTILLKLNAIQMLNWLYVRINVSPLALIVAICAKEHVENAEMVQLDIQNSDTIFTYSIFKSLVIIALSHFCNCIATITIPYAHHF